MFSYTNPSSAAMSSANQINPMATKNFQPYIDAGNKSMGLLQDQYGNLISDPGAAFNKMGQSFQQSPGFDFAMQQALQGSNHAAAAGGMAGSPEHEQQNQTMATNLANQDYYNYMNHATDLYKTGLSGEQDMMHQGYNASKSLTDMIAQELAMESRMKYAGAAGKNKAESDIFSDIASLL